MPILERQSFPFGMPACPLTVLAEVSVVKSLPIREGAAYPYNKNEKNNFFLSYKISEGPNCTHLVRWKIFFLNIFTVSLRQVCKTYNYVEI